MKTKEIVVTWHYADHPARWVIAIFSLLAALGTVGTVAFQQPEGGATNLSQVTPDFLTKLGVVAFSVVVVVACLRQRIDGYFVRNGETFEVDTGRCAPNFLAALSLFFELLQPSSWYKIDLRSLHRQCFRWFFPVRKHFVGRVNEIEKVALYSSPVGVNVVVYIKEMAFVIAEDLSSDEADRVRQGVEAAR